MDWTEKVEQKKKIRKMAYRMLWADFKDVVMSWNVLMLMMMFFGFFLFPYFKDMEDFNFACMYYFVVWVLMKVSALTENSFNYLPLSTKDILYYLKIRTNHQEAWIVLLSGVLAIVLDAAGVEVFWERGALVLIFLLTTVEATFIISLSGYSVPEKKTMKEAGAPLARRVRQVVYIIYGLILLFGNLIVSMFMKPNEDAKIILLVVLCAYLVLYIFRADVAGWVKFAEHRSLPIRSIWATPQQNQTELRDMMNQ